VTKKRIIEFVGWGFVLWLIGYILGFVFFMLLPHELIGWAIMPIGILLTLIVLFKKIKSKDFNYYLYLGISWAVIAIVFDYIFIVKMLNPVGGYYKIDVYLYYLLTFLIPVGVGYLKTKKN
jgi:hypothetical protein